jgi:Domain of unknown function (DUF5916)
MLPALVAFLLGGPPVARPLRPPAPRSPAAAVPRVLRATRISGVPAPVIDGRLDDPAWVGVPVATDFTQNYPLDGRPATDRTEARVLFTDDAVYVAMRAYDHPDSIVAPLTRRDVWAPSDYLHVIFDSYHDRRTAFHFVVNPVGVKLDLYHYDDTERDMSWDAVWDVAVARDSLGWTAEFRIPLSQLRYDARPRAAGSAHVAETVWGVNFCRDVVRRQEWSCWAPIPQGERRYVSRFGDLTGLDGLPAARRREVVPYVSSSVTRAPGSSADPFFQPTAVGPAAGVDAKLGMPAGLTLDLTVHPDFGQVEADPSEVNLSEFETTFQERRPFFVEGAGLFQMSIYEDPSEVLFYPRRIGRAPVLGVNTRGGYSSEPARAPIEAAVKLSGKTRGGWSVGALAAATGAVYADVRDSLDLPHRDLLEPATAYGVVRLQRDLRGGRSAIGIMGTATDRFGLTGAAADTLHGAAYAGAFDFRHRFGGAGGASYEVFGAVFGSYVRGSAAAIAVTQRSSAHYFERPDAPNLTLDTTRTSLAGWAMRLQVDRLTGHWRYGNAFYARSPGFEVNDLGIEHRANWIEDFVWVGREHPEPSRLFNLWSVYVNTWSWWTLAGERFLTQANIDLSGEFRNFWGGFLRLGWGLPANTLRLRGGPLLAEDGYYTTFGNLWSPWRGRLRLDATFQAMRARVAPRTWSAALTPTIQWQPANGVTLALGPSVSRQKSDMFYVDQASTSTTPHYVVSAIDWTTTSFTTRLDVAFAPALTFQLYAQPFFSAARYSDFKEVVDPRAGVYANRFRRFTPAAAGDSLEADLNGDGVADVRFADPSFSAQRFRSNAVLRWEYRPGSTLFVVWSQGRDAEAGGPPLFRVAPENVFLVKWSYWLHF